MDQTRASLREQKRREQEQWVYGVVGRLLREHGVDGLRFSGNVRLLIEFRDGGVAGAKSEQRTITQRLDGVTFFSVRERDEGGPG